MIVDLQTEGDGLIAIAIVKTDSKIDTYLVKDPEALRTIVSIEQLRVFQMEAIPITLILKDRQVVRIDD